MMRGPWVINLSIDTVNFIYVGLLSIGVCGGIAWGRNDKGRTVDQMKCCDLLRT